MGLEASFHCIDINENQTLKIHGDLPVEFIQMTFAGEVLC